MKRQGAYGQQLADKFRLDTAPTFVTRTLPKSAFAVTEINCRVENNGMTAPIAREDAFLVTLQLKDCPRHDLWVDGKPQRTGHLAAGTTCIYDLRCDPVVNSISSFHNLHFYFPRQALNTIAAAEELPPITEINANPGIGIDDPVLRGLGLSLLPAFEQPDEAGRLFVDHVSIAAASYLARTFGSGTLYRARSRAKLSSLQESRAKELIDANLVENLALGVIASECGMSEMQFSRAFRATTGLPPYRWMARRRIDKACDLLLNPHISIEEVALACGFSNLRQLERAFARAFGTPTELWRRQNAQIFDDQK